MIWELFVEIRRSDHKKISYFQNLISKNSTTLELSAAHTWKPSTVTEDDSGLSRSLAKLGRNWKEQLEFIWNRSHASWSRGLSHIYLYLETSSIQYHTTPSQLSPRNPTKLHSTTLYFYLNIEINSEGNVIIITIAARWEWELTGRQTDRPGLLYIYASTELLQSHMCALQEMDDWRSKRREQDWVL